jgi:hypothetical protein
VDIGDASHVGPVLCEHPLAVVVCLYLQDALVACTFETQIETADTSEERHELHYTLPSSDITSAACLLNSHIGGNVTSGLFVDGWPGGGAPAMTVMLR